MRCRRDASCRKSALIYGRKVRTSKSSRVDCGRRRRLQLLDALGVPGGLVERCGRDGGHARGSRRVRRGKWARASRGVGRPGAFDVGHGYASEINRETNDVLLAAIKSRARVSSDSLRDYCDMRGCEVLRALTRLVRRIECTIRGFEYSAEAVEWRAGRGSSAPGRRTRSAGRFGADLQGTRKRAARDDGRLQEPSRGRAAMIMGGAGVASG
jgi:hypothetical protein